MYNDQALALIKIWREASPRHKNKVLAELVRRLSYMVHSKIKYYKSQPFYSDLLQEGRLGLVKAIENFDTSRGINFFKFASWHILSRVNNHLKWVKRCSRKVQNSALDEVLTPQEYFEKQEEKKVLLKAIDALPEIDREVVMMRYGMGGHKNHTLKQVGDVFSLTKQRIQQIECRAIQKLSKSSEIKNLF